MAPPTPLLDPSRSNLAVVSGDGRLKIFGVASQRLSADLTPALAGSTGGAGLGADIITSLAWGAKGRIAAGTAAGAVKAVDSASASHAWTAFPSSVDGGVAALAHSPDSRQLLVVGRGGGAAVLDASTGASVASFQTSQPTLTAAAVLSGGRGVLAGATTTVVDLSTGAQLARWTAHASPVATLALPASEAWLASAGEGERGAAVWGLATGKSGKLARRVAAATLALRAPALALAAADVAGRDGAAAVAALLDDGGVEVFYLPTMPAAKDAPAMAARCVAAAPPSAGLLLVSITSANATGCTLLLASGAAAKPQFQTVRVEYAAEGAKPTPIAVTAEQFLLVSTPTPASNAAPAAARAGVSIVGVSDIERASVATLAAGTKRSQAEADEEMPEASGAEEEAEEDLAQGTKEGPTLGERLTTLQASISSPLGVSSPAVAGAATTGAADAPALPARPSAASLATLLSQALHAGDKGLLERCLAVRRESAIQASVRALGSADAGALLRALTARLGAAPVRGEALAVWVRATLRAHAGSLTADPGMRTTLGALHQQVEARLAAYRPLLSLAGRLDLVLAQAQRTARAQEAQGQAAAGPAPIHIQLGDDGGVTVEEVYAANGAGSSSEYSESGDSSEYETDDGDVPNGLVGSSDEED